MKIESGEHLGGIEASKTFRVEKVTGNIISVDSTGEATKHPFKTSKELKVLRREKTLKAKTGYALSALKPLVTELATHGLESIDTQGFNVGLTEELDVKNPFVVDGDIKETFRKSINFLLQGRGHNLEWIAGQLLTSSKIRNAEFPGIMEEPKANLVRLIRSANPSRFS
jgi:hypothetical protein